MLFLSSVWLVGRKIIKGKIIRFFNNVSSLRIVAPSKKMFFIKLTINNFYIRFNFRKRISLSKIPALGTEFLSKGSIFFNDPCLSYLLSGCTLTEPASIGEWIEPPHCFTLIEHTTLDVGTLPQTRLWHFRDTEEWTGFPCWIRIARSSFCCLLVVHYNTTCHIPASRFESIRIAYNFNK